MVHKILSFILVIPCFITPRVFADWQDLGNTLNVSANSAYHSTLDVYNGTPFVAWAEANGAYDQIYVKKYNGSGWEQLGGSLNVNSSNIGTTPAIMLINDSPYVAWCEGVLEYLVYVKRFNGSSWELCGDALNNNTSNAIACHPDITADASQVYVAWIEESAVNMYLYVKYFNGATWQQMGSYLNIDTLQNAFYPSISIDSGDVPYVCWTEYSGSDLLLHVKKYNGTDWELVGDAVNNSVTASQCSMAFVGETPFVSWTEEEWGYDRVRVKKYNGADWESVGGDLNLASDTNAAWPRIAFWETVPYAAFKDTNSIYVKKYNGVDWEQFGSVISNSADLLASAPGFVFSENVAYLSYDDVPAVYQAVHVKTNQLPTPTITPSPTSSMTTTPTLSPTAILTPTITPTPTPISQVINLSYLGQYGDPCHSRGMYIHNQIAYLTQGAAGLVVYDITQPEAAEMLSVYDTAGFAEDVVVQGGIAYVADGTEGLAVIDVSVPSSPVLVGTCDTIGYAQAVEVENNCAYVADGGNGINIIDLSESSNPKEVAHIATLGTAQDIAVSGGYVYVADGTGGLVVISAVPPENAAIIATVAVPGSVTGIFLSGSSVYALSEEGDVTVVDVSEPGSPEIVHTINSSDAGNDIYVKDGTVYIVSPDGTLRTVSINPTVTPIPVGPTGCVVPNPFMPSRGQKTYFNFASDQPFAITIYDIRGRRIRRLDTREWNGCSDSGHLCEGGVYIYQIEGEGKRVTGKIVLIK